MLWTDKHQPLELGGMELHGELTTRLKAMAKHPDMPHLLFVGPRGGGKKTRVRALIREIYGGGALLKARSSLKPMTTGTSTSTEVAVLESNYHVEMNLDELGYKDASIVKSFLKEFASSPMIIDAMASRDQKTGGGNSSQFAAAGGAKYKVVVLNNADKLSFNAQAALRRLMEVHVSTCRIVMVAESASQIIEPLQSRCFTIRVPKPSVNEMISIVTKVAAHEDFKIDYQMCKKICEVSDGDLRKALIRAEVLAVKHNMNQDISKFSAETLGACSWEVQILGIVNKIVDQQSPRQLMEIRGMMYELLAASISGEMILYTIYEKCLAKFPHLFDRLVEIASIYEVNLRQGQKEIMHLEAFIARLMLLLKSVSIGG